ncbi:MAG: S41 family peptidase, partial [Gemmatimonadota bacterium]|nr:S41 family peptidase [Gemmatimonadota bacterium]
LQFVTNPRRVSTAGERVTPYAGPVAVLTDRLSASASEVFAGGMQAVSRVRVFGTATAGAVLPASMDRLPNGDVLYHAFGEFETVTGIRLEGRGVVPDEAVALTRPDLLAGRDAVLEAALRWIAHQRRDAP